MLSFGFLGCVVNAVLQRGQGLPSQANSPGGWLRPQKVSGQQTKARHTAKEQSVQRIGVRQFVNQYTLTPRKNLLKSRTCGCSQKCDLQTSAENATLMVATG